MRSKSLHYGIVVALCVLAYVLGLHQPPPAAQLSTSRLHMSAPKAMPARSAASSVVALLAARPSSLPGQERNSITDSNLVAMGVTDDDLRKTSELNDLMERGQYILQFERPLSRKALHATINELASEIAQDRIPATTTWLESKGMDDTLVKHASNHLHSIYKASLEAEGALQQLLSARNAYDARMRQWLTPDQYADYRHFEANEPARRELSKYSDFLRDTVAVADLGPVDPRVAEVLQAAGAFTEEFWHGPYDGLPNITVGFDATTEKIQAAIGAGPERLAKVVAEAQLRELDSVTITQLSAYFNRWTSQKQKELASLLEHAKSRAQE